MARLRPFGSGDDDLFGPRTLQPCGHPPHVARTCAEFEADVLGISKPAPDDLKRAVLCHLDHDADAETAAQALNDQLLTATSEVRKWHGYDSRSGEQIFEYFPAFSRPVRTMLDAVMAAHRSLSSTVTETGVEEESRIIYSPAGYEPDDPFHMFGVAQGLIAGDPLHVEVLHNGPEPWLQAVSGRRMTCAWPGQLHGRFSPGCLEHTRDVIAWSRFQFLIVVPTCAECRRALYGGPTTVAG